MSANHQLESGLAPSFQVSQSTFAILRSISKISGPQGFLKWDREVRDCLKWARLWKYTQTAHPAEDEGNDLCCTALRQVVDGGLYHDITDINVAKTAYDKIVSVCKPKGSSALMATCAKFDILKAANYATINEYDTKFRDIINELAIYPSNPKMDENWLVYKYLGGLGDSDNARLFIERWTSEHEPFDSEEGSGPKYGLSDVIHAYEAQCANPLTGADKGVASLATGLAVTGTRVEKPAQAGSDSGHSKVLTQMVKWCNHCIKP